MAMRGLSRGVHQRSACLSSPPRAEQGFRVVDVWQSEEECNRFGEALAPILQEVGVDDRPEIYEAHTFVSA